MAQTKPQLIQAGIDLGIPAQRLKGTKAQIQTEIDSYAAALDLAAADTAAALNATATAPAAVKQRGIHPVNALALGAALGAISHFLG